jgi:hypothetical protein
MGIGFSRFIINVNALKEIMKAREPTNWRFIEFKEEIGK